MKSKRHYLILALLERGYRETSKVEEYWRVFKTFPNNRYRVGSWHTIYLGDGNSVRLGGECGPSMQQPTRNNLVREGQVIAKREAAIIPTLNELGLTP